MRRPLPCAQPSHLLGWGVGEVGSLCRATLTPCLPTDRATNPLNKELNWASINGFCEQLSEDLEG
jgi:hypothetical protein